MLVYVLRIFANTHFPIEWQDLFQSSSSESELACNTFATTIASVNLDDGIVWMVDVRFGISRSTAYASASGAQPTASDTVPSTSSDLPERL
jgi:hypothetical protein